MVFKGKKFRKLASYLALLSSLETYLNVQETKSFAINAHSNVSKNFLISSNARHGIETKAVKNNIAKILKNRVEATTKYIKNLDPFILKIFGVVFVSVIVLCIIIKIKHCNRGSSFSVKDIEQDNQKDFLDKIKKHGFYSEEVLKKGVFLPTARGQDRKMSIDFTQNIFAPDNEVLIFDFTFHTYKQLLSNIWSLCYVCSDYKSLASQCCRARYVGASSLLLKNDYSNEVSAKVANFLNFLQPGNILDNTWSRIEKNSLSASIKFLRKVLKENFSQDGRDAVIRKHMENRIKAIYLYEEILKEALCKKYKANIDEVLKENGINDCDLTKINDLKNKNWSFGGSISKDLFGNILNVLYSKFNEKKNGMSDEEINTYNILVDDLIFSVLTKREFKNVLEEKSENELSIPEEVSDNSIYNKYLINIFEHPEKNRNCNSKYYVGEKLKLLCKLFANSPADVDVLEKNSNGINLS